MKYTGIYYLFASLLFLSAGCATVKPEAPDITVDETREIPPQPISLVKVPIKINLKPYFEETNASVPKEFKGSEQQCDGVSYSYRFVRGNIDFSGSGNSLDFNVDGKYALKLNYCPKCTSLFTDDGSCVVPRIYVSCGVGEPLRAMHVGFKTQIGVSKDYKLDSKTKLTEVKAISPCKVSVFNYNATEKLENEVRGALKSVAKDIDKEISSVDLRPDMELTWDALCAPIDLEGYGFMYLNPKSVSMSDISFEGDTAYFDAYLKAYPFVYSDTTALASTPLPELTSFSQDNGFDVSMDISTRYDSLSSVLTQNISGMKTEIKGKEVIFDAVEVFGAADNQISIKVDFSGKKHGTLYLTGTPVFDAERQHISFPDLEFDVKTKSALLKSAKWLFDKKITDLIRDYASLELAPYLEEFKSTVDTSLNGEVTEGVIMNGKVENIMIRYIHPRQNELFIRVESQGTLGIKM